MDERTNSPAPPADLRRLLLLGLLAAAVHATVLLRTEVAARDSIGFIRYALQLDGTIPPSAAAPARVAWLRDCLPPAGRRGLDVVTNAEQPPGYPLAVLAVSVPVRHTSTGPLADAMVFSAQLASALAGVLLVVPMYLLGKRLFDGRVGFAAAALFQCLPVAVRATSDGLSEATFLLAFATTLWLAVRALQRPTLGAFLLCGLGCGLAYLTRPEGVLLAVAAALVLLGVRLVPAVERPLLRTRAALAAVAVGFAVLAGPYMALIGHFSAKPTPQVLLGESAAPGSARVHEEPAEAAAPAGGALWAAWWVEKDQAGQSRLAWGLQAVVQEMFKSSHYAVGLLALLGLAWQSRRLRTEAGPWLLLTLAGLHTAGLWYLALKIGYVSERHTLPVVLLACFWSAAAVPGVGRRLAAIGALGRHAGADGWAAVVLGALLLAGLPVLARPLHDNRAGHHAAGAWLAEHTQADDVIVDPFCWAHYYAGAVFREGQPNTAGLTPPDHYVVLEASDNQHSRLPMLPLAREWAARGELVYEWMSPRQGEKNRVQVFRIPGGR